MSEESDAIKAKWELCENLLSEGSLSELKVLHLEIILILDF
jgi:hypothetical protein